MVDVPKTRGIARGLQSVEPDDGVLVAYSAKHGTTAQDGPTGGNSPFAIALINHLAEPEDIRFVFGAVRDAVREATDREQEPFLYGSLGRAKVYLITPNDTEDSQSPVLTKKSLYDVPQPKTLETPNPFMGRPSTITRY